MKIRFLRIFLNELQPLHKKSGYVPEVREYACFLLKLKKKKNCILEQHRKSIFLSMYPSTIDFRVTSAA